jgi:hypothetical protein
MTGAGVAAAPPWRPRMAFAWRRLQRRGREAERLGGEKGDVHMQGHPGPAPGAAGDGMWVRSWGGRGDRQTNFMGRREYSSQLLEHKLVTCGFI